MSIARSRLVRTPWPRGILGVLTFALVAAGSAEARTVVLPWIAQTRGAVSQSSDLYLYNPGSEPVEVTLQFRRRGLPEPNPPQATLVVDPLATLVLRDAPRELFDRENIAGFLFVTYGAEPDLVITTQGTLEDLSGKRVASSLTAAPRDPAAPGQTQSLVGLRQDDRHETTLILINPGSVPGRYLLTDHGADGEVLGTRSVTIAPSQVRHLALADHPHAEDIAVVTVAVTSGELISAARVLDRVTNDPAYIQGETR